MSAEPQAQATISKTDLIVMMAKTITNLLEIIFESDATGRPVKLSAEDEAALKAHVEVVKRHIP